jgi:two-component system, sensor histidine kinase PdtaS
MTIEHLPHSTSKESDHRLLNDLQVIVSLLSLQSRTSANTEVASHLAAAADRIATIGCMHLQKRTFGSGGVGG